MPTTTNWSGQFLSYPRVCVEPETVAALQAIIQDVEHYPSPVVALGSGHSNSGCTVLRGGTQVRLMHFKTFQEPIEDSLTAGAGLRLLDVHRYLAARGLQLPFTPEIGNATLGSVACCCLKDAALDPSPGFAADMIQSFKYVNAKGEDCTAVRGGEDWSALLSGHGLLGIVYEVKLAILPMRLTRLSFANYHIDRKNWDSAWQGLCSAKEGVLGLCDPVTGHFSVEKRRLVENDGEPNALERAVAKFVQLAFKYYNPILGIFRHKIWYRMIRTNVRLIYAILTVLFPKGFRVYRCLKPIDYGPPYPFRWDFHFWAFPRDRLKTEVLPAFRTFVREYQKLHPAFDMKGLAALYFLQQEPMALLSPGYDGPTVTLDPLSPMAPAADQKEWDDFNVAYNDFAVAHGGRCTFNQTKFLRPEHAEQAFGERWDRFRAARRRLDPGGRFLSVYFRELLREA